MQQFRATLYLSKIVMSKLPTPQYALNLSCKNKQNYRAMDLILAILIFLTNF